MKIHYRLTIMLVKQRRSSMLKSVGILLTEELLELNIVMSVQCAPMYAHDRTRLLNPIGFNFVFEGSNSRPLSYVSPIHLLYLDPPAIL